MNHTGKVKPFVWTTCLLMWYPLYPFDNFLHLWDDLKWLPRDGNSGYLYLNQKHFLWKNANSDFRNNPWMFLLCKNNFWKFFVVKCVENLKTKKNHKLKVMLIFKNFFSKLVCLEIALKGRGNRVAAMISPVFHCFKLGINISQLSQGEWVSEDLVLWWSSVPYYY